MCQHQCSFSATCTKRHLNSCCIVRRPRKTSFHIFQRVAHLADHHLLCHCDASLITQIERLQCTEAKCSVETISLINVGPSFVDSYMANGNFPNTMPGQAPPPAPVPVVNAVAGRNVNQQTAAAIRIRATHLLGHKGEVLICAWSPSRDLLASGSGDSTARVWNMSDDAENHQVVVLRHFMRKMSSPPLDHKEVTVLDWNCVGSMLATGSCDGYIRIWTPSGILATTLGSHEGPILSLKWNRTGNYILTAGVDCTINIWDAPTGLCAQKLTLHNAPSMDVDWKNNTTFATCSNDKIIYVCKLGRERPIKTYQGHTVSFSFHLICD